MTPIDPIKLREAERRMSDFSNALNQARDATKALIWFEEYAIDKGASSRRGKPRPDAIEAISGARLVASSTPSADLAQRYVTKAAATFREAILAKAIEMAEADYDRPESMIERKMGRRIKL